MTMLLRNPAVVPSLFSEPAEEHSARRRAGHSKTSLVLTWATALASCKSLAGAVVLLGVFTRHPV